MSLFQVPRSQKQTQLGMMSGVIMITTNSLQNYPLMQNNQRENEADINFPRHAQLLKFIVIVPTLTSCHLEPKEEGCLSLLLDPASHRGVCPISLFFILILSHAHNLAGP